MALPVNCLYSRVSRLVKRRIALRAQPAVLPNICVRWRNRSGRVPKHHRTRLEHFRLDPREPHRPPLGRLDYRRRVVRIALLPLHRQLQVQPVSTAPSSGRRRVSPSSPGHPGSPLSAEDRSASGRLRSLCRPVSSFANSLIASQSLRQSGSRTIGGHDHGEHHDPQPRRRGEDPAARAGGGQRSLRGIGSAADPARCRRAQAEFQEPHGHHPLAFRATQRRAPGVADAGARARTAVLRVRRGATAPVRRASRPRLIASTLGRRYEMVGTD